MKEKEIPAPLIITACVILVVVVIGFGWFYLNPPEPKPAALMRNPDGSLMVEPPSKPLPRGLRMMGAAPSASGGVQPAPARPPVKADRSIGE